MKPPLISSNTTSFYKDKVSELKYAFLTLRWPEDNLNKICLICGCIEIINTTIKTMSQDDRKIVLKDLEHLTDTLWAMCNTPETPNQEPKP